MSDGRPDGLAFHAAGAAADYRWQIEYPQIALMRLS
jgi:hypothetical protein